MKTVECSQSSGEEKNRTENNLMVHCTMKASNGFQKKEYETVLASNIIINSPKPVINYSKSGWK